MDHNKKICFHNSGNLSIVLLLSFFFFFNPLVYAGGFQVNENSPRLQGQAFAGNASSPDDVTAIFYNPATLGFLKKSQVYVGSSYVSSHIHLSDAVAEHQVNAGGSFQGWTVSGSASQGNVLGSAVVPNFYGAWKFTSHFTGGLAISAPWGAETHYDNDSVVRFMSLKTSLQAINIAPELAYQVNDTISFGGGLQIQHLESEFSNFNGALPGTGITPPDIAVNPTDMKMAGWGVGYLLGVIYHPAHYTYLGISYRSQVNYHLSGAGDQYTEGRALIPRPSPPSRDFLYNIHTMANANINTPAMLDFSLTQNITQALRLNATAELTFWKSLRAITIAMPAAYAESTTLNLNWRNSWLFSVGPSYTFKHWVLRSGIGYDETPTVASTRDTRIPDSNRILLTTGATYKLNKHIEFDAAYEHIFVQDQSINVRENVGRNAQRNPLEINHVIAGYSGSVDVIALGFNYRF